MQQGQKQRNLPIIFGLKEFRINSKESRSVNRTRGIASHNTRAKAQTA
jgi:hypothetical protein